MKTIKRLKAEAADRVKIDTNFYISEKAVIRHNRNSPESVSPEFVIGKPEEKEGFEIILTRYGFYRYCEKAVRNLGGFTRDLTPTVSETVYYEIMEDTEDACLKPREGSRVSTFTPPKIAVDLKLSSKPHRTDKLAAAGQLAFF